MADGHPGRHHLFLRGGPDEAGRETLGKFTSFDIVLAVLLGSILSRTLTANAELVPTLAAAAALVLMHRPLAMATFHSHRLGRLIKGAETRLVDTGEIDWQAMRNHHVTEHDLVEALRTKVGSDDIGQVRAAYLERNSEISVISR